MDLKDVQPYIEDKVCMVTGGGGSIGSEIVCSLSKLNAEKIVIVDIYENGAYSVKCEVGDKVTVEIASVRDYEKMDCIMNKYRPDIVFHAAAHNVMAAAVADYRPATVADDKIKKKDGDLSIPVERTADILGTIGPKKTHQFLCGFSMETRDMVENSTAKLTRKNLDMVVANNLKVAGAGFGVDTNVVTFITPDGTRELPLMSKADVADAILDEILKRRGL